MYGDTAVGPAGGLNWRLGPLLRSMENVTVPPSPEDTVPESGLPVFPASGGITEPASGGIAEASGFDDASVEFPPSGGTAASVPLPASRPVDDASGFVLTPESVRLPISPEH